MKNNLLILGLSLIFNWGNIASGQTNQGMELINHSVLRVEATLDFNQHSESKHTDRITSERVLLDKKEEGGSISDVNLFLKNAELILDVTMKPNFYTQVDIQIDSIINIDTGMHFPIKPAHVFVDSVDEVRSKKESVIRMVIANTTDNRNPKMLSGHIALIMSVKTYSYAVFVGKIFGTKVQRNQPIYRLRPFSFKRGRALSLIGTGLTAAAFIRSQKIHDESRSIYFNNYKTKKTASLAQEHYDEANELNRQFVKYRNAGRTLGVATLAWTIIQQLIQVERITTYKKNCDEGFKIQSWRKTKRVLNKGVKGKIELITPVDAALGLKLEITF